jgi:hypothetical protein
VGNPTYKTKTNENILATLEKKTLRKIFVPVQENGVERTHVNQDFIDLYTEPDTISETRKGRLQWLGNVRKRMPEEP